MSSSFLKKRKLKKLLPVIVTVLFVLLLPLLLLALFKPQDQRSGAAGTARLFFTPSSTQASPIQKGVGDTVTLDLMLDPGQSVVSFVKFEILYDATKLTISGAQAVQINTTAFSSVIEGPVTNAGSVAASIGIGSDPTKGITAETKVATITFTAAQTTTNPIELSLSTRTQVLSIGPNDQSNEDVLGTKTPAYVAIGASNVTPGPSVTTGPTISGTNPTGNPPTPTKDPSCNPFAGTMTGDKEVPATPSTEIASTVILLGASGGGGRNATVTINSSMQNPVTAIHIHAPADPGVNAPPVVTLYEANGTDVLPETFTTEVVIPDAVIANMREGRAYMNIHTQAYPNGEIRGQIVCASLTPTPSIDPRNTRLRMSLLLHGIGAAGDNPNPKGNSLSNKNPSTADRPISIQVLNSNNQIVVTRLASVSYDNGKGNFQGLVDLGIGLTEGSYVVKIKSDRYLRKLLPGFYELSPGKEFTVRETDLVAGDINDDNTLNVLDYNVLYDCGYGALNPIAMADLGSQFQSQACQAHTFKENADLNDDGTVASNDYNLFIRELSVQLGE